MRPPFPHVLDNSALSAFRSCPRKFQLEYLEHWKPNTPNVHLHAGQGFARGLEVARESYYVRGETNEVAVARGLGALLEHYGLFDYPEDSNKTPEAMAGALVFYFDTWPLEAESARPIVLPGGSHGIEFSFLEPLGIEHPETGDPILYSGRFDMICHYAGGIFGEDDKTASQLGATWPNQWALRSQFDGYIWGAGQSGLKLDGMLVRGVSILKTGFGHAQTPTYRPPWMIERWYDQTLRYVRKMLQMWDEGYFDYNLDESCNAFGGCIFKQPCQSEEPQKWLEVGFQRRRWDPVTRQETVL